MKIIENISFLKHFKHCEKFRAFWKRPTAITLKVTKSFLTMIIILTHMSQQSYDSYVK